MNKIIIILFLLISTMSFAQMGIVNYDTIQSKAIQADSALWIKYLENGGTDILLTHIEGKVAYVLPSQFLLTQFDSTGFRIGLSQISNLSINDYQLDSDTLDWDATRSWVEGQGYITTQTDEADPLFQDWDKQKGINIYKKQVIDLNENYFEKELVDGEDEINVGFTLDDESNVFFNGEALPQDLWSGKNTTTINLSLEIKKYDFLIVKQ